MSIHSSVKGIPGHLHRQRTNAPTLKQKAAERQAVSTKRRAAKITIRKAPWQKEACA